MAFPSIATVEADVESIYTAFSTFKTKQETRVGVHRLNELVGILNRLYLPKHDLSLSSPGADLAALFAGEGSAVAVGDVFRVDGSTDTGNSALEGAKGSAPAADDVFIRSAAAAVIYLGNVASGSNAFDFDGETAEDFVSIGS